MHTRLGLVAWNINEHTIFMKTDKKMTVSAKQVSSDKDKRIKMWRFSIPAAFIRQA